MINDLFRGTLVRLAAPMPADNEFFARWSENANYLRLLDADPAVPRSAEGFAKWEENLSAGENSFLFRIRTLPDDSLIGFVNIDVNWPNQNGFLAIGIGDERYWGQGYGTDAMTLILNYGFNELSLHHIGLNVISNNTRAIALYKKLGFVYEGAQREVVLRDGERYDLVYFGLLRQEWVDKI